MRCASEVQWRNTSAGKNPVAKEFFSWIAIQKSGLGVRGAARASAFRAARPVFVGGQGSRSRPADRGGSRIDRRFVMPQSALPCPESKNRLNFVALAANLHARGAAQPGATGRNILLQRRSARSKPFPRKPQLNRTQSAGYECTLGAKWRFLRAPIRQYESTASARVCTPRPQIDSPSPGYILPRSLLGEWMGRWILTHRLDASDRSSHSIES
jgi:hypothetical protein